MNKQLKMMREFYDRLKLHTDNGFTNHTDRCLLRQYEMSEFYRDPGDYRDKTIFEKKKGKKK